MPECQSILQVTEKYSGHCRAVAVTPYPLGTVYKAVEAAARYQRKYKSTGSRLATGARLHRTRDF